MAQLKVEIDDEIWLKFRNVVKRRYGGVKGYISRAVEDALRLYIESSFKSALELLEEQRKTETKPVIYTIGYEGKTISNFIDILQKHGVKLLVDVRELPLSRKNGFSKSRLKEMLNKARIEYLSIRELGAPKDLRHELKGKKVGFEEFRRQYEEHLNNNLDAIRRLEELAKAKLTAIMCYEADWRVCHRSIIAEYLKKDGFEVIHL